MDWQPYSLELLRSILKNNDRWFLDGGESLDVFMGHETRDHEDIDVGILSTDAKEFLEFLQYKNLKIFKAKSGSLEAYKHSEFRGSDYNYWVSDDSHFRFQVLVYFCEGNKAYFRRNTDIWWPIELMTLNIGEQRIIHPLVAYTFKVTNKQIAEKDLKDIHTLSKHIFDTNSKANQ